MANTPDADVNTLVPVEEEVGVASLSSEPAPPKRRRWVRRLPWFFLGGTAVASSGTLVGIGMGMVLFPDRQGRHPAPEPEPPPAVTPLPPPHAPPRAAPPEAFADLPPHQVSMSAKIAAAGEKHAKPLAATPPAAPQPAPAPAPPAPPAPKVTAVAAPNPVRQAPRPSPALRAPAKVASSQPRPNAWVPPQKAPPKASTSDPAPNASLSVVADAPIVVDVVDAVVHQVQEAPQQAAMQEAPPEAPDTAMRLAQALPAPRPEAPSQAPSVGALQWLPLSRPAQLQPASALQLSAAGGGSAAGFGGEVVAQFGLHERVTAEVSSGLSSVAPISPSVEITVAPVLLAKGVLVVGGRGGVSGTTGSASAGLVMRGLARVGPVELGGSASADWTAIGWIPVALAVVDVPLGRFVPAAELGVFGRNAQFAASAGMAFRPVKAVEIAGFGTWLGGPGGRLAVTFDQAF